jgi:hypothetical protein
MWGSNLRLRSHVLSFRPRLQPELSCYGPDIKIVVDICQYDRYSMVNESEILHDSRSRQDHEDSARNSAVLDCDAEDLSTQG